MAWKLHIVVDITLGTTVDFSMNLSFLQMYKYTVDIAYDITVTSHIMKAQKLCTVSTIVNITFSNTVDYSMN